VKLILARRYSVFGDLARPLPGCDPRSYFIVSHEKAIGKQKVLRNLMFTKENQYQRPSDATFSGGWDTKPWFSPTPPIAGLGSF
jgi:hypothetical protein